MMNGRGTRLTRIEERPPASEHHVLKIYPTIQSAPNLDVAPSLKAFPANRNAVARIIQNRSGAAANCYISDEPNVTTQKRFTVPPGTALNLSDVGIAPSNAIYMAAEPNHLVELLEILRTNVQDFLGESR